MPGNADAAEDLLGRLVRRGELILHHGGWRIGLSVAFNLAIAYSVDWLLNRVGENHLHTGLKDFADRFNIDGALQIGILHGSRAPIGAFITELVDKVVAFNVSIVYIPPGLALLWVLYAWSYASATRPTPSTSRGVHGPSPRAMWRLLAFACTTLWAFWGALSFDELYPIAVALFKTPALPFIIAAFASILYVGLTFHIVGTLLPVPNMLRRSVTGGALFWHRWDRKRARNLASRRH